MGKSWLLSHLVTKIAQLEVFIIYLIDLAPYRTRDPLRDPLYEVMDILKAFARTVLGEDKLPGATPAEMSRALMERMRRRLQDRPLTLLVDSVYESDWRLLAALEDYLLGPLAIEPRVLIVMAGRGRPYPWKTPELRLKADFWDLQPFQDEKMTEEQLRRQRPKALEKAAKIHELSGGNPLANRLLAEHDDPTLALDQVIQGMLETVAYERQKIMREYLEALCVLNSFDEDRIPTLLAVYYHDNTYAAWGYAQARDVRQEIVKWSFARWDETQGGYVIDELTRSLIERYMKTAEMERWRKLNCAAYRLYENWVQNYPRSKDRWQRELESHANKLIETNFSPENCPPYESQAAPDSARVGAVRA